MNRKPLNPRYTDQTFLLCPYADVRRCEKATNKMSPAAVTIFNIY